MSTSTTTVEEVDLSIDQILNPGAESVMLPEEKKLSIFSAKPVDLKFLDNLEKEEPPVELTDEIKAKIASGELNSDGTKKVIPGTLEDLDNLSIEETEKVKTGRPKTDKQGLVELTKKLIEKKIISPFKGEDDIDKYTLQDFEELFEANAQDKEEKLRNEVPVKFFDSLPEELQYAASYVANGGRDLKGLFKQLAFTEEIKSLDPVTNPEAIVKTYLQAKEFGTEEDIQEEIDALKDRNELEAKAKKFKPKLDEMQEQIVAFKLQEQEQLRVQQEEQATNYINNVYKVLEPGELNGIKLDKKVQGLLYHGLTKPSYPSVSGKQTNLLGHLLEKYQFVEPNHSLIAEVLWLLSDPDGYKEKVKESTKKEVVEKTVKTLRGEESRKLASTVIDDEEQDKEKKKTSGVARPGKGFFSR